MVFVYFNATKAPCHAAVKCVVHFTIQRPHYYNIIRDRIYSSNIIHGTRGHYCGLLPSVTSIVRIQEIGVAGWRHENAALWTEGYTLMHVIAVDLFPRLAFILRTKEATVASHGKKVAI